MRPLRSLPVQTISESEANMSSVYRAAHTPGPWAVSGGTDKRTAGYVRRVEPPIGELAVARVMQGRAWSEQMANANLIAAAPELLAALQFYVSICGNTCAVVDRQSAFEMHAQATAAIAKAMGAP